MLASGSQFFQIPYLNCILEEEPKGKDLLGFSQTCELLSSKADFTIAFSPAVNHNYDHRQRTLKHRNTQNGSKSTNHQSQTMMTV